MYLFFVSAMDTDIHCICTGKVHIYSLCLFRHNSSNQRRLHITRESVLVAKLAMLIAWSIIVWLNLSPIVSCLTYCLFDSPDSVFYCCPHSCSKVQVILEFMSLSMQCTMSCICVSLNGALCRQQEGGKGSVEVNPMTVFHAAVLNAKPLIGTTRMTRGGKHYHVWSTITLMSARHVYGNEWPPSLVLLVVFIINRKNSITL